MNRKIELLNMLLKDGYTDIHDAVLNKTVNSLTSEKKKILSEYGWKIRAKDIRPYVPDALIEVTTSGWGNEPESILLGW